MKIATILLLFFIFNIQPLFGQVEESGFYPKQDLIEVEGYCYTKTLLPLKYAFENSELPIYYGLDIENSTFLDTIYVFTGEQGKAWRKQKADRNCLSADPKDCIVWRLVNVDKSNPYVIVNDTSRVDPTDYYFDYIDQSKIDTKKHTKLIEVLCPEYIDEELLINICEELMIQGYHVDCESPEYNSRFKATLTKYQKDNGLPIGNLNIRTLVKMEIELD